VNLIGVINSFATGTYTVSRRAVGTSTDGRYTPAAPTTFDIRASIQPVTGREIAALPEPRRGAEVKVVYTTTVLRTESPAGAADVVAIDGENWEVWKVERWEAFGLGNGDTHYRVYISRTVSP
jgi:hypothetical protein